MSTTQAASATGPELYNTAMPVIYAALGSNLGDRHNALRRALAAIAALPRTQLLAESPIYETPPMGPQDQGAYLNMAAMIDTNLDPEELIAAFQSIERDLGRAEPEHRRYWGPREIDIDLLFYDDLIIDTPTLNVPHPGLHQRWFVLKPLADLAPDLRHPVLGQTIARLLASIESQSPQESKR